MQAQIAREALARMFPRASSDWLDALVKLCPELFEHYKITRLRWVHFAGQIAAETNGLSLRPMQEDMNYSAERMLEVYGKRLQICVNRNPPQAILGKTYATRTALARAIAHKPELIADVVYGGREGTPWMQGHRYIGRGPAQTTHLNGYRAIGAEIARQPGGGAFDLVACPELLATDAELGVRAAFANFQTENLWIWADRDDCDTLSDALNTGSTRDNVKPHGLPRRRTETARAKAIWPADAWDEPVRVATAKTKGTARPPAPVRGLRLGDSGPEVQAIQERLTALGFQAGQADGTFGKLTQRALAAFQLEHALVADGIAGPRTMEVLAQADVPDIGPRQEVTEKDLADRGSRTIGEVRSGKTALLTIKGLSFGELIDQYFDLGIADRAISKVEQVKSLMTRGQELTDGVAGVAPTAGSSPAIMILCGVLIGVCVWQYMKLSRVGQYRVQDARSGANMKR